jgi:hypothetical protein
MLGVKDFARPKGKERTPKNPGDNQHRVLSANVSEKPNSRNDASDEVKGFHGSSIFAGFQV